LRRQLGANGALRAREAFDWSVVIRAYEALWDELAEIRPASVQVQPLQPPSVRWPEHLDPFDLFAGYASTILKAKTQIRLTPDAETEAFEQRLSLPMASVNVVGTQPLDAFKQLRDRLRGGP
jgi:alpha-maltose-1-phosphate synthase